MSFLKVKRKCNEDPKETFVLASKKFKLQDVGNDAPIFELKMPSIKEEDIQDVLTKAVQTKDLKSRKFDLERIRKQMRNDNIKHAINSRYRLLESLRKMNKQEENQCVPVIDVENVSEEDGKTKDYVYDLYYSSAIIDLNDSDFVQNHYLHEISNKWDTDFNSEDEETLEDEDDSNDENNWRNDYPDDEDLTDDYDCSLSRQMRRTRLSSSSTLSSDEYDESLNESIFGKTKMDKKYFDYYNEVASDTSDDD